MERRRRKRGLGGDGNVLRSLERKKGILLSKARTNRWTQCNWYLTFIKQKKDAKCKQCGAKDTTEHVIDKCSKHDQAREDLRRKLSHWGNISSLLASKDINVINLVANYLETIVGNRKIKEDEARKLNLANTNTV